MNLLDIFRHLQGKSAPGAAGDDGAGEDVRRDLVERGGESQHLVGIHLVVRGDDVGQNRVPLGQRPGLVEQHHMPAGKSFEGAAALDNDTDVRGAGQAGHDRDRRREQQRAWRRDDEHGDGADRVTAQRPGRTREDEGQGHEEDGEPVGGPDERR
jgi:hypothetical protein